ncbi:MAG: carbon-nitrogen hydrolase family protein [Deinococcales bacterium]
MRIAVVQMTSRPGDKDANLRTAASWLETVAGTAEIACLPETFEVGYDLASLGERLVELAEVVPGPTTEALAELARRFGLGLVAGVLERDPHVPEVLYDTAVVVSRSGALVGRYRKSHLFPTEHRFFRAGNDLPVFDLDGVRVGVAICFELAFPEIFSTLARRGAQLVLNPSAVPVGYAYLQDLRSRARAQDNQIYVAAVNHVGEQGTSTFCGASQIADPRGDVLARAADAEGGVVTAELDLDRIRSERLQEPVFRARRPELYEP